MLRHMFKTKQQAQELLALLTPENYFTISAGPGAPLAGVWSKSALKQVACNTSDWLANVPFRATAKTEFGNLVDIMATEPKRFEEIYVMTDECDKRRTGYKAAKALAEESGKQVVTTKDLKRADAAIEALQANKFGRVLLAGEMQRIFTGVVKLTGPLGEVWVPLKAKTDSVTDHGDKSLTIEDLKTTEEPTPGAIRGVCKHLSYHWQDAIYTELAKQNGYEVRDFRFVFVGTNEPFHVQPAKFDQLTRQVALKNLEKALSLVYWLGHGYSLDRLYPEELILGPYVAPESWWDTCPDFSMPLVEVDWQIS